MSKKIKVAAYARVSTEHEAQIYALGNQLEWYKKEIAKNPDYELVNIYVDEGITGTSANKRDGFMRMIEDAKKGKFQKIITRETARFARNTIDTLLTVEELEEYDVSIEFVCDSINTEDKDSELRLSIMAAMAQEESRKISQRVKCGQQVSMENGVIYGNGNILGYDRKVTWIDEKTKVVEMVINPEQAKTVKMIFDWYLGGWGIEKIKYELEKAGRLTAQGKTMWHASVISKTLKNSFYCGIMVYHKEYTPSYKKQKKKINYDKIPKLEVEGKHEPIVSKEDFDRVQKKLESRRQSMPYVKTGKLPKGHRPATSIWCSILECACGHNFNRRKWNRNKTSTQYGYQCYDTIHTGSVQTRKNKGLSLEGVCDTPMVQEWKLQMMSKAIFDNAPLEIDDIIELASSMIEKHIGDTPEEVSKNNKGIEEIRAQIEKLEKRIDGYLDMCADGEISKEKFLTKKAQAESEIKALEEKLEKLTPDDTATVEMPSESIAERLKALKNALLKYADFTTEDDVPDKIVDAFVEKVVVSKDGFDWYMRYSPENAISCNVEGRKGKTNVAFAPNTPFTSSRHRQQLKKASNC